MTIVNMWNEWEIKDKVNFIPLFQSMIGNV